MDTSNYKVRKPKVRDMRALAAENVSEEDRPYAMAARCITYADGRAITLDEVLDMDAALFSKLVEQMNAGGEGNAS
jgi:hypothetical protein